MGTAHVQGDLWSASTQDWADLQERVCIPLFEAVSERLRVGNGMRLLDVGCGAGGAAQIAARRGARVSGLDASGAMIEIARKRVPDGDFSVGEIEELPYADHCAGYLVYPFQNQEINSHARNLKPSIWCVDWKEKELVEPSLPLLFWNGYTK
jgi:SAM-dependent methyltransferase